MVLTRRPALLALLGLLSVLTACREAKVTSYRAPKDSAAPRQAPAAPQEQLPPGHPAIDAAMPPDHPPVDGTAPAAAAPAADSALTWTAPANWTPKPGSGMRRATFSISGPEGAADLAVISFPGDVGGDLANVNRWRGQLGLPPVPDLSGALDPLEANGLHIRVFDAANQGNRMLGAIVPVSGETWFFKLTGPDALVAREKPAFLAFLKTVRVR